jgi:prepilin-type processing-associated H-X9-DG protein
MQEYVKEAAHLGCPSATTKSAGVVGFAFFQPVLAKQVSSFDQSTTAYLFDSTVLKPNAAGKLQVPSTPRHKEGNNICYLDGHMRSVR